MTDPIITRLWENSTVEGECWVWNGRRLPAGYGHISINGKSDTTHAHAFRSTYGPVPSGKEIDHECVNPPCWRPDHLRALTHLENVRRGGNAIKTHCKRGHEFTPENTYNHGGHRYCKNCNRISHQPKGGIK